MRNNNLKIQIGLTAADAVWDVILRQIGIASQCVSMNDDLVSEFSVIIINSQPVEDIQTKLDAFVNQGGAVLFTSKALIEFGRVRKERKFINSLPPRKNDLFEYHGILDIFSTVDIFSNDDFVHSELSGIGSKYYLGLDVDPFFLNATVRKNFYTHSERMPNEVVSVRGKGTLRQLIFSLLKGMHHQQSLPFIHQWYYPGSERTIFTFRIDSDKGTQEHIEEIRSLGERYSIPTTWFLDVKSHEHWLPYFRSFGDQEIGLHCYEHVLYKSTGLNKDNFEKALSLLRREGIQPNGITAPTGGWHDGYAEAIRELGFGYSSEFSYDYDNLPSFPIVNGESFPIPQFPIHPVCIGTMLRVRMSDEQMVQHFRSQIDMNLLLNEPICLYQHPTHRHNGVFEQVFQYINTLTIAKLTYSDYAEWWKHRNESRSAVLLDNGNRTVEAESESGNVQYRIILPDGKETITALAAKLHLDGLKYENFDRNISFPMDLMRSREFDIRHLIQNGLDWWIKTTA